MIGREITDQNCAGANQILSAMANLFVRGVL